MSVDRHRDHLSWEQSVNERYLGKAQQRSDRVARLGTRSVSTARNTAWTGDAPQMPNTAGVVAPLIGRVALSPADQDLGLSFYVGSRYTDLGDGTTVVSWAADAARLFFEGRDGSALGPESVQPRVVQARRSFKSQGDRLVSFEDDLESGADADSAFLGAARLSVPAPPAKPGTLARSDRSAAREARTFTPKGWRRRKRRAESEKPVMDDPTPQDDFPTPRAEADGVSGAVATEDLRRASKMLAESLEAPKRGALAPVLATLQPEQYRLVTWPSDRNLLVQGHPGTGKTIVAAHRAACLVLPRDADDKGPRLHRVALVGPTDRWRNHIAPSVGRLVVEGVDVLSLESLVRGWAGDKRRDLHIVNERWFHSLWEIGRIVERSDRAHRGHLTRLKGPKERSRALVNALVRHTETHRQLVPGDQKELRQWLLEAGSYEGARDDASYLLFLAAVGLRMGRDARERYQHIVVDEAQDIRPIEWWMLTKLLGTGGEARWSILGDMNQRRSDFTWDSWTELTDRLELTGDHGEPVLHENLDSGYRSTREILRYADSLLPRAMRGHTALRSGPEPYVRQVGRNQVLDAAQAEALQLANRYPRGSVAVIAWDQESAVQIERSFLRQNWKRNVRERAVLWSGLGSAWVSVSRPVEVRGLEFDAVVVVEPADFVPNVGRHGELYTSLTRANQELVVVHSKAMPHELRGRGRRNR